MVRSGRHGTSSRGEALAASGVLQGGASSALESARGRSIGESLAVRLDVPKPAWRPGDQAEVSVCIENLSEEPLCIRLGAYAPDTDGCAVLAAACLCSENAESARSSWTHAKMLEPRSMPGCPAIIPRERGFFLPGKRSARMPLVGRVVGAGPFGNALRFGGGPGEAAEVLLPLPPQAGAVGSDDKPSCTSHQICCRITGSRSDGGNSSAGGRMVPLEQAWAWVGPYEPSRAGLVDLPMPFSGEVSSVPVTVFVGDATQLASATPDALKVHELASRPDKPRPPGTSRQRSGRRPRQRKPDAKASIALAPKEMPHYADKLHRPETEAATEEGRRKSTLAGNVMDYTNRLRGEQTQQKLPGINGGGASGAAQWRGLSRSQDPLADPLLLELAEEIERLRVPNATLALCGAWLKTRTGQRFATASRTLAPRVISSPDARALSSWTHAPRGMAGPPEGLILMTDPEMSSSCFGLLQRAWQEQGLEMNLYGFFVVCDRQHEAAANTATAHLGLTCHWRVLPSLVFCRCPYT